MSNHFNNLVQGQLSSYRAWIDPQGQIHGTGAAEEHIRWAADNVLNLKIEDYISTEDYFELYDRINDEMLSKGYVRVAESGAAVQLGDQPQPPALEAAVTLLKDSVIEGKEVRVQTPTASYYADNKMELGELIRSINSAYGTRVHAQLTTASQAFDRALLREVSDDFTNKYGKDSIKDMYAIRTSTGQYEAFLPKSKHFPQGRYWNGQASSLYHAKAQLLQTILNSAAFDEEYGETTASAKTGTRDPGRWAAILSKLKEVVSGYGVGLAVAKDVDAAKASKDALESKESKESKESLKLLLSSHKKHAFGLGDNVYYRYCSGDNVQHLEARVIGVVGDGYRTSYKLRLMSCGSRAVIDAGAKDIVKSDKMFL